MISSKKMYSKSFVHFPVFSDTVGLCPIVNSSDWLLRLLQFGMKIIQVRIKDKNGKELEELIKGSILLGRRYDAKILINDHWEPAIRFGAWGVHLGQKDMKHADLSALSRFEMRVGLSVYDQDELEGSLIWNPSYISFGPVFHTGSKKISRVPQGIEKLKKLVDRVGSKKIYIMAIGGIDVARLRSVLSCGVNGIAVISSILRSEDWKRSILELSSIIQKYRTR